jgi:hypothetical protein
VVGETTASLSMGLHNMDCWNFSPSSCGYQEFGAQTASTFGQTLVTGGTNAKGSWAQLGSTTLAHCAKGVIVSIKGVTNGARHFVDLGIGTSGNEVVLIENIPWLFSNSATNINRSYFPCDIPAGTQINVRSQTNTVGGSTTIVMAHFLRAPLFPWAAGQIVDDYGADTSTTNGTTVTAAVATHTKGSWAQLTASTARAYKGIIITPGYTSTGSNIVQVLDVGIGAAASEQVIIENICMTRGADIGSPTGLTMLPCNIPAGARVVMRSQCNVTVVPLNMMFFGVA